VSTDDPPLPADKSARRLTDEARGQDHLSRLCHAAATALTCDGCAVHLLLQDGAAGIAALSSTEVARVADLAFTVGEGPTVDAFTLRRPVLAGDLTRWTTRWPGFVQAAADLDVLAVLSFPLQVGGAPLGVLDLYASRPRSLDDDETSLALAFAELATETVLQQPEPGSGPGPGWTPLLDHRAEVHQAQGMVMVDLRVDMREALVRMRAHAFREGIPLIELARAIIAGARLPTAGNEHQ
jgi:hypothetical protein